MDEIDSTSIELYQQMYERDPNSQVFAPLAEAYRKLELFNEGIEVAEKGVQQHPNFAGGRVALGRLYSDVGRLTDAERELQRATEVAPENLLAHQLYAEVLLKLKKSKEALRAYKMLLFLSPDNPRALRAVHKLESLTADEYEDDVFTMKPLSQAVREWDNIELDFIPKPDDNTAIRSDKQAKFLDRVLSLADAYIVRNDVERAADALNEAERIIGPHTEIVKRLKIIHNRQLDAVAHPRSSAELTPPAKFKPTTTDRQIEFLQDLLQKIKNREI